MIGCKLRFLDKLEMPKKSTNRYADTFALYSTDNLI